MVKRKATFGHRKAAQFTPSYVQAIEEKRERRQALPRKVQLKNVQLIFNNGFSTSNAILRSLSETGAKIETHDAVNLPETFTMVSANGEINVKCLRVWRDHSYIGLKFVA